MHLLFLDESGCLGSLPAGPSSIQPVLCLAGLMINHESLPGLTREWIDLKRRFFPNLGGTGFRYLDWQKVEIKGSALRRSARETSRNRRRHAFGFIDKALDLLRQNECKVISRVWIKDPGAPFDGNAVYTSTVQEFCTHFHRYLKDLSSHGLVIADSRRPGPNSVLSHSVFTQKHKYSGDPYPRIIDSPVFGHSDNHTGLQLADLLASALLFPISCSFYLDGRIDNSHIHSNYDRLAQRYVPQLDSLQLRYTINGRGRCGIVVADPIGRRGAERLFSHYAAKDSG